ncbi:ribonuclease H family protein, partial [Enterobacter cloacae complex sp. 4DZ3-17B2]|uniref:Ty3/Gypsy family RNase HI domain-containing protein n=1 Tax=Enterobacter cloacae complex sp. 4DZ3-17B2 TaxID=2511990 RepID=UPI0013ED0456
LQYPNFNEPFIITTNASGYAIGAILSQGEIGKDRPIAYTSRVLNDHEKKYETYDKEALAIYYAILHFRPYVYGKHFTVVTDHKPLTSFRTKKDPNSRVAKWMYNLLEYEFEVIHKAGKSNVNADALSRNPIE